LGNLPIKGEIGYTRSTQTIKINPDDISDNQTKVVEIGIFRKRKFLVRSDINKKLIFKELKSHEDRLKELKNLLEEDLITHQVYQEKVNEIVKEI